MNAALRREIVGSHVLRPALQAFVPLVAVIHLLGCSSAKPPKPLPTPITAAERSASQAAKLLTTENWTSAATQWQRALDEYRLLNDRTNEAIALHNLAEAQRALGKLEPAHDLLESAASINSSLHLDQEWWRNQIALLQIESQSHRTNELAERFAKLTPRSKTPSSPSPPSGERVGVRGHDGAIRPLFLNELGLWHIDQSDFDAATADFRDALQLFVAEKNDSGVATVLANQGLLLEKQKKFKDAAQKWQEALQRFEKLADRNGIATALLGRARALLGTEENLPEAQDLLHRAERNFRLLHNEARAREAADLLKKAMTAQGK